MHHALTPFNNDAAPGLITEKRCLNYFYSRSVRAQSSQTKVFRVHKMTALESLVVINLGTINRSRTEGSAHPSDSSHCYCCYVFDRRRPVWLQFYCLGVPPMPMLDRPHSIRFPNHSWVFIEINTVTIEHIIVIVPSIL